MPNNAARAKLFMPFDSLKGFQECLRQKEKIIVPKKILLEDHLATLNHTLQSMTIGDMIQVTYYYYDHYRQITGLLSKINLLNNKTIYIVTTPIPIADIIDLEIIKKRESQILSK